MAITSRDSYKLKNVEEWSSGDHGDVLAFLEDILPSHPCHNHFKYTNGNVLVMLSRDDIRRQARNEEAANIIWVELQKFRKQIQENERIMNKCPLSYIIYVRTPVDNAIEVEVSAADTTWSLKQRVAELEGTPPDNQRLICCGHNMEDAKTLASYKVGQGTVLLLVPRLSSAPRGLPSTTPRGQLMVPGNRPWQPNHALRPYIPIVAYDHYRPFPMNLEFSNVTDYHKFMRTVQDQQRVEADGNPSVSLEILPTNSACKPVHTKVSVDAGNNMVCVDTVGDMLNANGRYKGSLNTGFPNVPIGITLTTGNSVA